MATNTLSIPQQRIAEVLSHQFGIAKDDVYFLNSHKPDEPWLNASALMTIARTYPQIREVSERFDKYVPELKQVIYVATVILENGRTFERSGVATVGEKLPDETEEADEHRLAAARAIRNALVAAGIDPLKQSAFKPVATFDDAIHDDAQQRGRDLARIHVLAGQKGLIKFTHGGKDPSQYKAWLFKQCKALGREDVTSASELNQQERASIISALEQLPDTELV